LRLPALSREERRLALLLVLTLPLVNPVLRGEGNGHYAWVASLVVDRDLDAAGDLDGLSSDPTHRFLFLTTRRPGPRRRSPGERPPGP